jgi:oligopeptide transport system ATP-binding protein
MSTTTTTELQMQDGDVPGAPLLQVRDLNVTFHTRDGDAKAINGVDLDLAEGETLAILGESGSGKSVTAQCIMGILDMPPGEITSGTVHFRGQELLQMPEKQRRHFRGQRIAMIFQDALSALNPVYTVGFQIGEMFTVHRGMSRKDAKARAVELMERVRIPGARSRVNDYPHQFSGGMRQRIMIASAIALEPDILIADEPTTALDVTVQAQIMELLADLRRETGSGLILITHDLGVVAEVADRINVMYTGRVIEQGKAMDAFVQPAHPYTQGLLDSLPRLDSADERLFAIKGLPPNLMRIPPGCPYSPRCPRVQDICRSNPPPADIEVAAGHFSACHFAQEVFAGGKPAS